MPSEWRQAIDEHRDALERIAESDLPISEDVAELLAEADAEAEG